MKSLLSELDVPISSQTLVFSKTSLQRQRISPRSPRAIYFNDEVYVGYCQQGEVLEISVADPALGTVFYTLNQEVLETPKLFRQTDNCLQCHASSNTRGIPGHLIRSVFVDHSGLPLLSFGTHRIDHSSPIANRWGLVGTSPGLTVNKHNLGNLVLANTAQREPVENSQGAEFVTDLGRRFNTSAYLSPDSDLVAARWCSNDQTEGHNLLTRANFQTREAAVCRGRFEQIAG